MSSSYSTFRINSLHALKKEKRIKKKKREILRTFLKDKTLTKTLDFESSVSTSFISLALVKSDWYLKSAHLLLTENIVPRVKIELSRPKDEGF